MQKARKRFKTTHSLALPLRCQGGRVASSGALSTCGGWSREHSPYLRSPGTKAPVGNATACLLLLEQKDVPGSKQNTPVWRTGFTCAATDPCLPALLRPGASLGQKSSFGKRSSWPHTSLVPMSKLPKGPPADSSSVDHSCSPPPHVPRLPTLPLNRMAPSLVLGTVA